MAPLMEQSGAKRKASVWRKMDRPLLYRYTPSGMYYLRGRFGGPPIRISLRTKEYGEAIEKLEEQRKALRAKQRAESSPEPPTLAEAVCDLAKLIATDPSIKEGTRTFYKDTFARLKPGMPHAVPAASLSALVESPLSMAAWWDRVAAAYKPRQANQMLQLVRRAFQRIHKRFPALLDPTADLSPVKVPRTRLELLTCEQFGKVVQHIRAARKTRGAHAADYVEFMAYSGCRPKEIRYIEWRDVNESAGVIQVWGGPDRTKNGEMRLVPVIPPMAALLIRMRGGIEREGPLFSIKKPHEALRVACEKAGARRQRIYDLRHLFATTCLESGVDVPTFAAWMGHKDGGALALRTYVQNRSDHRDRMAAKVTFA